MPLADARFWSDDELREAKEISEKRFIFEREEEGPAAFYASWDVVDERIRKALLVTEDLRSLTAEALLSDANLWQTLRYFCAPPISEEDLWTLVGKKFKRVRADFAGSAVKAFLSVLDHRRFPWVAALREPVDSEREIAIAATSVLMAHEALKTSRRGKASKSQEAEVGEVLKAAGLVFDAGRSTIHDLDALKRGSFSRERKVAGAKCDVPVRLFDGRLLTLECKVSNGPKNSWKRLQREVGGKADTWRGDFGSRVVTGAVLAGVFDLSCVVGAQKAGRVAIFWQHDLAPLIDFIERTKSS